jgi:hypothetical protein
MTIIQTDKPLAKRREHDFYPTPRAFCDEALALLNFDSWDVFKTGYRPLLRILDPGCGTGVWGQAALARWSNQFNVKVDGVEIRDVDTPADYHYLYRGDFRLQDTGMNYDLIIGNPPFKYAESFVHVGLENLNEDGMMLYLLPLSFLASKGRAKGLFRHTPPMEVHVAHRVSFSGNGKVDNTDYAVYIWKQGWRGETSLKWMLRTKS